MTTSKKVYYVQHVSVKCQKIYVSSGLIHNCLPLCKFCMCKVTPDIECNYVLGSAKEVLKIWHNKFHALLCHHILRVGTFCYCII